MITPYFKVNQDLKHIIIAIKAPYAKITAESEPEFNVGEYEFVFYSKPYYLRLHFSNKLSENADEVVTYDNGVFTIMIVKAHPGEEFSDLDMLTKLLTPSNKKTLSSKIEVVGDDDCYESEEESIEDICHVQELPEEEETDISSILLTSPKYGFANLKSGVFLKIGEELGEAIDLKNPDKVDEKSRKKLRISNEDESFNDDHFVANLKERENIEEIINYTPFWFTSNEANEDFDEEEKQDLFKLPRRSYILSSKNHQKKSVYLGLIDILFAFAYDYRTTLGCHTVESGWTICKLSSTLSWLDSFTDFHEVAVACVRRSLCFPLYRNYDLSVVVLNDVHQILQKGKLFLLKCFLVIRKLLVDSYDHYILNELYINDYCSWIQQIKPDKLAALADALKKVNITKADVGLDLEVLEAAVDLLDEDLDSDNDSSNDDDDSSSDDDDTSDDTAVSSDDDESKTDDINKSCDRINRLSCKDDKSPDDDTLLHKKVKIQVISEDNHNDFNSNDARESFVEDLTGDLVQVHIE